MTNDIHFIERSTRLSQINLDEPQYNSFTHQIFPSPNNLRDYNNDLDIFHQLKDDHFDWLDFDTTCSEEIFTICDLKTMLLQTIFTSEFKIWHERVLKIEEQIYLANLRIVWQQIFIDLGITHPKVKLSLDSYIIL